MRSVGGICFVFKQKTAYVMRISDGSSDGCSSDLAAALLRVLGHGVRLRLMTALVEGERSVGDLETVTGTGQPMLSQQLGILRKAALVKTRREAKHVFYRLDRDRMRDVSTLIDRFAGRSEEHTSESSH